MPEDRVSVIIPCYRQAEYLGDCVDSVLMQSHQNIEIIVVNDGSDDHTDDVAARFSGRITYLRKENGGVSSARNAGIRVARGRYLMFLDADDLLHRDGVGWLVAAMEGREDRLCLMGMRQFKDDPEGPDAVDFPPLRLDSALPRMIHHNLGSTHSYLFSRSMVESVDGFDRAIEPCEDWDMWLRLALRADSFISVPRIGAYYRCHPGSASGDKRKMHEATCRGYLKHVEGFKRSGDLLSRHGRDLFMAMRNLRRIGLVRGMSRDSLDRLAGAMRELETLGFGPEKSLPGRLVDRVFGGRSEEVSLAMIRFLHPAEYRGYQDPS
jgi:glycosyltransferase involved in cell wall biosynthesis